MTTAKAKYTPEDDKYLIDNYDNITATEAAQRLNRSVKSIYSRVDRLRRQGHDIAKKDPRIDLMAAIENSTYEAGTISTRICSYHKKPYKWIKLKNGKSRKLHLYLWENAHGKLPTNKVLRFKDGNPLNCTLDNLICVSKAEVMKKSY